jgi:hypothetical protein
VIGVTVASKRAMTTDASPDSAAGLVSDVM